jgi:hypothetical protein
MADCGLRGGALGGERGQASLLLLGLAVLVAGTLILFGFGQALGTRSSTSARPTWARCRRRR